MSEEEKAERKPRKRYKNLLKQTKNQLEFYFSDANLRHDRFLRKEITDNGGFVDLKTMLKFNKLKSLTSDESVLAKAVEISENLQLNDDGTKLKRSAPLPTLENVDQKTVYVEQFPIGVDHDWLKEVFSKCGTVEYISLPRHKHNNKVKGFAFIEFSNQQEAEKACQMLNKAGRKTKQVIEKNERNGNEKNKKSIKRKHLDSKSETDSDSKHSSDSRLSKPSERKKKCNVNEFSDNSLVDCKIDNEYKEHLEVKKKKTESNSQTNENIKKEKKEKVKYEKVNKNNEVEETENIKEKKKVADKNSDENTMKTKEAKSKKKCESSSSETLYSAGALVHQDQHVLVEAQANLKNEALVIKPRKKNRQHKHKDKDITHKPPPLYVISKAEWLSLKNQYKALQKQNCSKIKNLLVSEKVRQVELMERIRKTIEAKKQGVVPSNELVEEKKESADKNSQDVKKPKIEVVLGTVLKMKTDSESLTRKEIKDSLLNHGVAYVDYVDGSLQGYIRFKTKENVDTLMQNKPLEQFTLFRLEENEEKAYFQKAEEDKVKNYQLNERKKSRKRERGYEKLVKKIDA